MLSTYEKLGKEVKDLFEEHYTIGQVKINVKNKIDRDLGFEFNGLCNTADENKVTSSLETKYDMSTYGFQTNVKWTTDSELISEFVINESSNILQGLKLSYLAKNAVISGKKSGSMKAAMESAGYNVTANLEFEGDAPKINASGVYKYNDLIFGLNGQVDVKGHKFSNQSVAVGYVQGDMQAIANVSLNKEITASICKGPASGTQRGVQVILHEEQPKLTFAMQQSLDGNSTIKAKVNNDGQVGLAYVYQYKPGIKLSICSLVEAKNLFTGGHKIGLGMNFDA